MNNETQIRGCYEAMCAAMIAKDESGLDAVLDDSFVLIHMTGVRQSKEEFISAVLDGTLNYYSAQHEYLPVEIHGSTAVLTGRTYVEAAVYGGAKRHWRLQQICSLKKINNNWKITRSTASIY